VRILDIGQTFGMPVASIYSPWKPEILASKDYDEVVDLLPTVDLVTFGGGQDIHPSLYHHNNVSSYCGKTPSYRDLFESEVFKLCVRRNIPMVGICRGSQFLCAMSGGFLIQDAGHHALGPLGHEIITKTGETLRMSSTHHQMMFPFTTEHELVAWSPKRSQEYVYDIHGSFNVKWPNPWVDPEIVFFPKTRSLAIQGHPEYYDNVFAPPVKLSRSLTRQYFNLGEDL